LNEVLDILLSLFLVGRSGRGNPAGAVFPVFPDKQGQRDFSTVVFVQPK